MLTRMTSLAALMAAGMTLAACQEEEAEPVAEETTTEETVAEEPVAEEPVTEELATEEPVTEEPVTEEATAEEPELEQAEVDVEVVDPSEEGATDTSGDTGTSTATDENAAEVESQAAADESAAEVESQASTSGSSEPAAEVPATGSAGSTGAASGDIAEVLTVENFDADRVVTYLEEESDLDATTRDALVQAVEEVDTSNETALSALITRLEIALDLQSGEPAAETTSQ